MYHIVIGKTVGPPMTGDTTETSPSDKANDRGEEKHDDIVQPNTDSCTPVKRPIKRKQVELVGADIVYPKGARKAGEFDDDDSSYNSNKDGDSSRGSNSPPPRTAKLTAERPRDDNSLSGAGDDQEEDEDGVDDNQETVDGGVVSYGDFVDDAGVSIPKWSVLLFVETEYLQLILFCDFDYYYSGRRYREIDTTRMASIQ